MKRELLHISFDWKNIIHKFTPRVPEYIADGENANIKRVCVSDTIEGCLKAHPLYSYKYIDKQNTEYGDPYEVMEDMIYLKRLDISGLIIIAYRFEIDDSIEFVDNKELINKQLVPDAILTNECWITKEIKPTEYEYILITETSSYKYISLGKNIDGAIDYFDYWIEQRKKDNNAQY